MSENIKRKYCLAEDEELFNLIIKLNEILEEENRYHGIDPCEYCKNENEMGRAIINSTHSVLERIRIDSFTVAEQMRYLRKTHIYDKCETHFTSRVN